MCRGKLGGGGGEEGSRGERGYIWSATFVIFHTHLIFHSHRLNGRIPDGIHKLCTKTKNQKYPKHHANEVSAVLYITQVTSIK